MKLAAYLITSGLDEAGFAAKLGVSPKAVRHWLCGLRIPRSAQMQKIVAVTNGAVQPNDFLPAATMQTTEAAE